MIFADTGAFYALWVPDNPDSTAARAWYREQNHQLVTTDYVVDKLLTLMRARGKEQRAQEAGRDLLEREVSAVEHVSEQDVQSAWEVFCKYDDKGWSFTDCTSMVVMQRLGIETAFAFDDHFRQFGTVTVVP